MEATHIVRVFRWNIIACCIQLIAEKFKRKTIPIFIFLSFPDSI